MAITAAKAQMTFREKKAQQGKQGMSTAAQERVEALNFEVTLTVSSLSISKSEVRCSMQSSHTRQLCQTPLKEHGFSDRSHMVSRFQQRPRFSVCGT